jgi:hypothetical protein
LAETDISNNKGAPIYYIASHISVAERWNDFAQQTDTAVGWSSSFLHLFSFKIL